MMWNCIEVDPFKKGAAYFVGTRYKLDDFTPYIYKTEDYGKTWKQITSGIPKMHFTRCIRADHVRPGLLYAGTEYGMYISYDDGNSWKPFQLNLPVTPITDLTIKENDLIVATQGRAFYSLDDLSMLQQMDNKVFSQKLYVFNPQPAYRFTAPMFAVNFGTPRNAGSNPPAGAVFYYYANGVADSSKATIKILDANKKEIKTFATDSKERNAKFDLYNGLNQFVWDLRYPEAERIDGMILWNGNPSGIIAPPGNYYARFKIGQDSVEVPFVIKANPNYKETQEEYQQQFQFLSDVKNKFDEVQKAIKDIRSLRTQINGFITLQGKNVPKEVKEMADR